MSKPFLALFAAFVLSSPLAAQSRSVVSSTDLDSAVTATRTDARATVQKFVESKEVQAAATLLGISPVALAAKVARLDSAEVNRLAQQLALTEDPLTGGANILGISIGVILLIILLIWIFD
jgi:hypothetical protein